MNDTSTASHFATTPGALPADAAAASDGASHSDLLDDGSTPDTASFEKPAESMLLQADAWMQRCRTEVRAHPMSAVAMAFFAGMLVDRMRRAPSRGR